MITITRMKLGISLSLGFNIIRVILHMVIMRECFIKKRVEKAMKMIILLMKTKFIPKRSILRLISRDKKINITRKKQKKMTTMKKTINFIQKRTNQKRVTL
jgi:hypothetical protein